MRQSKVSFLLYVCFLTGGFLFSWGCSCSFIFGTLLCWTSTSLSWLIFMRCMLCLICCCCCRFITRWASFFLLNLLASSLWLHFGKHRDWLLYMHVFICKLHLLLLLLSLLLLLLLMMMMMMVVVVMMMMVLWCGVGFESV